MNATTADHLSTLVLLLLSTTIFFLTLILGVWVAYDRDAAMMRFIAVAAGLLGVLLAALLARNNQEQWLAWGSLGAAFLILGFTIAFWGNLERAGGFVAAGLALLLPLAASAIAWTWQARRWRLTAIAAAAFLLGLFALLMSDDRSAILGFMIGGISALFFYWRLGPGYHSPVGRLADLGIVLLSVILLVSSWLLLTLPQSDAWIRDTALGDALISRLQLWRTVTPLIQDYQFTGSGLGSTAMVYSTYIFLVHVPFHAHVHNLFLQIAVEQGVPGLIGFLGMVGATFFGLIRTYRQASAGLQPFYVAAWMSSIALVVYGLLDSDLSASGGVFLMFVPFGFALLLLMATARKQGMTPATLQGPRLQPWLAGSTPVLLIAALWFGPGAQAAQQANWGAVVQTRAELALYHQPTWPLQDAVRRGGVDLTAALHYYYRALERNPHNVTAHRRLGQIRLSQGDMTAAQQHLELAYAASPNQLVTRQLLGEVYGVTGQIEEAAALWRTVANQNGQLALRYWWYNHLGAPMEAERIKQVITQVSP